MELLASIERITMSWTRTSASQHTSVFYKACVASVGLPIAKHVLLKF